MRNVARALIFGAALSVSAAHADILLDDFSVQLAAGANVAVDSFGNNKWTVKVGTTDSNTAVDSSFGCVHILGCTRNIYIENNFVASGAASLADVTMVVRNNTSTPNIGSGNELAFSIEQGSVARATLMWDAAGLGLGRDFTGLAGFEFLVNSDGGSLGNKLVQIQMVDGDGDKATYLLPAVNTEFLGPDGYALVTLGFSEVPDINGVNGWTYDLGFDMNDIFSVSGVVNLTADTKSLDFALRAISVVPEPGSVALIAISLIGLGAVGRQKKIH